MPERIRLAVLASGRGSNLQAILDAVRDGRLPVDVALVASDRRNAPALDRARNAGVPAFFCDPELYPDRTGYDRFVAGLLKEHGVNLVALAGYLRIVTKELIDPYRDHILNIHPSLLPAFPGLRPQRKAIEHGVRISGCTVHLVTEQVDQGPIVVQAAVPVYPDDTEETLAARILKEEHRIYPLAIRWFAEARVRIDGRRVEIQGLARPYGPLIVPAGEEAR